MIPRTSNPKHETDQARIARLHEIANRDSAVAVTVRADDLRALLSKLRAPVADEWKTSTEGRDPIMHAVASLAAAISLLERTPKAKKAAASDTMFAQMLEDYRVALENARAALANAPVAVTYLTEDMPGVFRVCDEGIFGAFPVYRASAPVAGDAQKPVAWAAVLSGGKRSGRVYATCDTREEIEAYIQDVHQSNDSLTLYARPLSFADAAPQASDTGKCDSCEGGTHGLNGEPKWCCYCGAKLSGKPVDDLGGGPLARSYPSKELAVLAERAAAQIAIQWMQGNPGRIPSVDELRNAWALAWD